jgi:hypothetical protein
MNFHAHIINCCFAVPWVFCTISPLSIVLFHFEKDNKHGLLNSSRLKLVPYCQGKRNEVHQCKIPNTNWILGSKEPFAWLQNLCDGDLYVWWKLSEQFTIASKKQSMAITLDKLELQNLTLEAIQLFIRIFVSK